MHLKNKKQGVPHIILISFLILLFSACTKENDTPAIATGTMTDIDGNVYSTVKIGTKFWMAENLKVKRYNNGDSIYNVAFDLADSVWGNLKTGAYCYSDEKYGFLYNHYCIDDSRKIAPIGWHIPSDDEWKEMEVFLGMSAQDADKINWRGSNQGNKLKSAGGNTTYWATSSDIYTIFGTNESGFNGIGGACRMFDGKWGDITHTAFWWTSSVNEKDAWYRGLDYNKTNVFRYCGFKNYGFSIRCVKD